LPYFFSSSRARTGSPDCIRSRLDSNPLGDPVGNVVVR